MFIGFHLPMTVMLKRHIMERGLLFSRWTVELLLSQFHSRKLNRLPTLWNIGGNFVANLRALSAFCGFSPPRVS